MYDLVVVGGGPAGIAATERAARMGANVCLVEAGRAGGTDAVSGVVPARTLAYIAHLHRNAQLLGRYGIETSSPQLDFERALARCADVVDEVHASKEALAIELSSHTNLEVREHAGVARFTDASTLILGHGERLQAERFVICTGGHPRRVSFPGSQLACVPADLWRQGARLPGRAVILGTGHTGIQIASILNDFGCKVMLLERGPQLLAREDRDVADAIHTAFEARGIEIVTGAGAPSALASTSSGLTLTCQNEDTERVFEGDTIVMSLGWIPNTDALGLSDAGVEINERGFIAVSDQLQTSKPHIYAAGDVTGRRMLVTSATQEGYVAAGNALRGTQDCVSHQIVSTGGYPFPEHGSVGLTEADVSASDCEIATVRYSENTRAIIDGNTYGFCKLIVDRDSQLIVGAHVVGERAVEIVQLVATGMKTGLRVQQLASVDLAYPTYMQIVGKAATRICGALGLDLRHL